MSRLRLRPEDALFVMREQPMDETLRLYLKRLGARGAFKVRMETDAQHILGDMAIQWPGHASDWPLWEDQALGVWTRIVDFVYALAANLYARSVVLNVSVANAPLPPPVLPQGFGTYVAFDVERRVIRHCFLSPHRDPPEAVRENVPAGLVLVAEPVGFHFHQPPRQRRRRLRPYKNIYRWTLRALRGLEMAARHASLTEQEELEGVVGAVGALSVTSAAFVARKMEMREEPAVAPPFPPPYIPQAKNFDVVERRAVVREPAPVLVQTSRRAANGNVLRFEIPEARRLTFAPLPDRIPETESEAALRVLTAAEKIEGRLVALAINPAVAPATRAVVRELARDLRLVIPFESPRETAEHEILEENIVPFVPLAHEGLVPVTMQEIHIELVRKPQGPYVERRVQVETVRQSPEPAQQGARIETAQKETFEIKTMREVKAMPMAVQSTGATLRGEPQKTESVEIVEKREAPRWGNVETKPAPVLVAEVRPPENSEIKMMEEERPSWWREAEPKSAPVLVAEAGPRHRPTRVAAVLAERRGGLMPKIKLAKLETPDMPSLVPQPPLHVVSLPPVLPELTPKES